LNGEKLGSYDQDGNPFYETTKEPIMKTKWMRLGVAAFVASAGLLGVAADARGEEKHAGPKLNVGGVETGKGGSIKGVVKFEGRQAARKAIRMSADAFCDKAHAEPQLDEKYVWGENGTLQNVFVYVSKGLEGKEVPASGRKAELDQTGCVYVPHVQGVVVNEELLILNNDATLHNVNMNSQSNGRFNIGMPAPGMKEIKKFTKPEIGTMTYKCDVHPWMLAYVHVVAHPYFAVTQADGTFEIKGLPAGEYEVSVWHEMKPFSPDKATQMVKVEEGKAAEVTVTYAPPAKP